MPKLKVLHITTHDEECGIAKYQEQFLRAMKPLDKVENAIFPYSPNKLKQMSKAELAPVLEEFSKRLRQHDLLHIQHEFSFYSKDELAEFVAEAKRQQKPVIITVHTALYAGIPKLDLKTLKGGPRHILGKRRLKKYLIQVHVDPLKQADLILVHNAVTANSLAQYGIQKYRIRTIAMPVPKLDFKLQSAEITKRLNRQPGDIILCTVGFLSENKGMRDAVQALQLLPDNYKLVMIGGAHPSGANDAFCAEVQALIDQAGLGDRAYITGYVKEDEKLNAMIRECDICVYPFHKRYYAGVSSASLNNSLANYLPAVTYPTQSILEMNAALPAVVTAPSFNPEALAMTIRELDIPKQTAVAKHYAEVFGYDKEAVKLTEIYRDLA